MFCLIHNNQDLNYGTFFMEIMEVFLFFKFQFSNEKQLMSFHQQLQDVVEDQVGFLKELNFTGPNGLSLLHYSLLPKLHILP